MADRSMTRRSFLGAAGLGAIGVGMGLPRLVKAAQDKKPPNIIVMMADDLGAHELGCYGHPVHKTPHLDALAEGGVQVQMCYATPLCHPTRYMIMTGQYAHHNGVYNFGGRRGGPSPEEDIIADRLTFGQLLKRAGYKTAHSGKWQLSGDHPTLIRETGFDEYCMWAYKHNLPEGVEHTGGWESGKKPSRYWHPSIVRNGEYVPTKPDDYGPDIFSDFVIDFAQRNKEGPFFIYYPMALTHGAYYTTPDNTKGPEDHFVKSQDNWRGYVEYLDKVIGKIVKALEKNGLREDTVIVFTADNGTGGNGKGQPTEMGARVPMIVNCPGRVEALGKVDSLVDLTDVFPTVAELAGAPLPQDRPIDGRSLVPLLQGDKTPIRDWIYSYLGDERILRTRRWLLEANSPHKPGRFYDCKNRLDGKGYMEVTNSNDPEVVAARKRFDELLKDKAVPDLSPKDPSNPKGKKKRKVKAQ